MSTSIDRRKFLTYTGAAGAAAGSLWVAPSVVGSSSAFAINSASACTYAGTLLWASSSWASGGTGNDSWISGDLSSGIPQAPDNSSNGASRTFVAKVGGTGNSYVYVRVTVTAIGPPLADDSVTPASTGGPRNTGGYGPNKDEYAILAKTAVTNPSTTSGGYTIQVAFFSDSTLTSPTSVSNLSFDIRDIDGIATTYSEQIWITGASGVTRTDSNTNISSTAGTSGGTAWHNVTTNSDLTPPNGNITVSIPSANSFVVHDAAKGTGPSENHGWSIGSITWGC